MLKTDLELLGAVLNTEFGPHQRAQARLGQGPREGRANERPHQARFRVVESQLEI